MCLSAGATSHSHSSHYVVAGDERDGLAQTVQALWDCLQILRVTGPAMHPSLTPQLLSLLPGLVGCCWHSHTGIHQSAASCAEALVSAKSGVVLPPLLRCGLSEP